MSLSFQIDMISMPKIGEIKIEKGAVVCVEAQIEGNFSVEIGAKTVVHPKAQIIAEKGPIKIGNSTFTGQIL